MSSSADQGRQAVIQDVRGSQSNGDPSALAYMAPESDSNYTREHSPVSPRNGLLPSSSSSSANPPERAYLPHRASTFSFPHNVDQRKQRSDDHPHARSEDFNHSTSQSYGDSSSSDQALARPQPFLTASRPSTPGSSSQHTSDYTGSSKTPPGSVHSDSSLYTDNAALSGNAQTASSSTHTSTSIASTPCAACGKAMQGAFVRALGTVYHLQCFKCMDCGTVVASKFFPIDGPDGKQHPLCERDYFRRLNLICAKCGMALRGSYITACRCNSAILKQFVEINRNMRDECWHPECYMINKGQCTYIDGDLWQFWNVKVVARRPALPSNSEEFEGEPQEPPWTEEERRETAISLKEKQIRMEQQVYRIWTVLSAFEESSAACISDMLRQVSNGQYLEAIRMAEKFILHVEVLFATIDDLEWHFARLKLKGMSHVREARMLCRKTVDLFTLLSHTQETGARRMGMTQELLALVTGLAHYLKILIRIALTGALKLEREHNVQEAITSFLDKLHMLAIQGGNPSAKRMMKRANGEVLALVDNGNTGTQGVTYGFKSLAPENAGESPFMGAPRDPALAKVNVVNPPSDLCAKCNQTVEEDCVRLGTYQRWHSHCLQCDTCGKVAAVPAQKEAVQARNPEDKEKEKEEKTPKLSTARRPPANVGYFVYDADTMKDTTTFGPVPTKVYCVEHGHGGCKGGFMAVARLEQYAFLLNVALRRLYVVLKKRGVVHQGQVIRPPFARNNTGVMIVDDSAPTSPTAAAVDEPTMPAIEDGITLADIPQIVEAAQAREQHRSLPRQSSIPFIAELSTLELAIVRHCAVVVLSHSPLQSQFDLDEILELVENKKNSFWKQLFKPGNDKKNVKKKGVFGVPLELLVEREGADSLLGASRTAVKIPSFVDDVVSAMRQMDLSVEGIFRRNGNIRRLKELTEAIDRDPSSVDLTQDNPVQLAALLKKFFRELPDPLLTYKLHRLFIASQSLPTEQERMRMLHMVSLILPKAHRETLEVLSVFLKWVASFAHLDTETGSKMDLQNLATVICPSILYSRGRDAVRDESFGAIRVVTALLENQDELYCVPQEFLSILQDQDYFVNSLDLPSKEFLKKCETYMRLKASGRTPLLTSPVSGSAPFNPSTPRPEDMRAQPPRSQTQPTGGQYGDRPAMANGVSSDSLIRNGQQQPRQQMSAPPLQHSPFSYPPPSSGMSAIHAPQPRAPNVQSTSDDWTPPERQPYIGQVPSRPSSMSNSYVPSRSSGEGSNPFAPPNGHSQQPAVRQRI
ncbi:hypothetical protein POSPLADRAFT_1045378 [Postia placenta MAD-698-R-SB12]|uniref:RhoGAP-domain-containing protein n=1 Tax=Postia placenta MAD-698-R-SB12 TaxID=670580 RepID=A0A1X6N6Q4_9APHY|nr:hypothetical protein POSPLADRAFT_1045378 [Postia placenta MAD-698-R-SB12]OSX64291.1 hypothetical protein POSPLADRAFT_1045378 [Postia placenta MAD-698-R-SB12]